MPTGMWLYSYAALWLLQIVESILLILVIRQLAHMHAYWTRREAGMGLPLDARAPAFSGRDLYGRPVSLTADRGRKTLVLFLSTGCGSCRTALGGVLSQKDQMPGVEILLVLGADIPRTRLFMQRFFAEDSLPDIKVLPDPKQEVTQRYHAKAVPYAVVVDEEGYISATYFGLKDDGIVGLIEQADLRRMRRLGLDPDAFRATATPTSEERPAETIAH